MVFVAAHSHNGAIVYHIRILIQVENRYFQQVNKIMQSRYFYLQQQTSRFFARYAINHFTKRVD